MVSIILFLILEPYNYNEIFKDIIEIIKIIIFIYLILEFLKILIKCLWQLDIIKKCIFQLLNYDGNYKNEDTFMKINFIVSYIIYFIIDYIISIIIKLKNWAFEENVENRLSLIHGVSLIMITIIGGVYTFLKFVFDYLQIFKI